MPSTVFLFGFFTVLTTVFFFHYVPSSLNTKYKPNENRTVIDVTHQQQERLVCSKCKTGGG